jgi:hypothetical protein
MFYQSTPFFAREIIKNHAQSLKSLVKYGLQGRTLMLDARVHPAFLMPHFIKNGFINLVFPYSSDLRPATIVDHAGGLQSINHAKSLRERPINEYRSANEVLCRE